MAIQRIGSRAPTILNLLVTSRRFRNVRAVYLRGSLEESSMVCIRTRLIACRIVQAFLVAALLFPATALAQFDTATVLGAVHDTSGAIVPGATVTLKNVATGITATTLTDGEGNYQFLNVRIGSYTVRAELQGFSVAEADNVSVTVNARLRVDLSLKVGSVGETVTVEGAAKLLETDSS